MNRMHTPMYRTYTFSLALLVTGALLLVGCDSSGSSSDDSSPEESLAEASAVVVELEQSKSASNKSDRKASGDLTVAFHYENDSGDDCSLMKTTDAEIPYNEEYDPTNISGDCTDPADFDGITTAFEPSGETSADGLVLSIMSDDGTTIASDDNPSDGLTVSEATSDGVDLPDDVGSENENDESDDEGEDDSDSGNDGGNDGVSAERTVKDLAADPAQSPAGGGRPQGTGRYALFSFEDDEVVLASSNTDRSDSTSTKWDLGFQSINVLVNNGDGGPGNAAAYVTKERFDDVGQVDDSKLSTSAAQDKELNTDWYNYNANGNNIVRPEPARTIVVRTADGDQYAKMRIVSYYKGAPREPARDDESRYYTFDYVLSDDGSFE